MTRRIRTLFSPLIEVARPISLRTWLLIILGPIAGVRIAPYLGLGHINAAVFGAVFVILAAVTVWFDYHRPGSGRVWPTAIAIGFVTMLVATSITLVPKQLYSDELLATEVATEGLSKGLNPYSRDYRGTLLDEWIGNLDRKTWINGQHPSAEHYVYFPGAFLAGQPLYGLSQLSHFQYDQRYVYLAMYLLVIVAAWFGLRRSPVREALVLSFGLNPFLIVPLAYGFNDLNAIAGLGVSGLLLARRQFALAAFVYGLTLATKQWTLVSIPFLAIFLWNTLHDRARFWRYTGIALAGFALLIVPFLLWSPHDFLDDTVGFFVGTPSYPISGEGISQLLLQLRLVGQADAFPFWIFELVFALPAVAWLLRWLQREPTLERAYLAAAAATWIVWFFSRYLLNFHVVAVIMVVTLAFMIGETQRRTASP